MEDEFRKYLIELGFNEVPCRIPSSNWQHFKRNIYIRIERRNKFIFKLFEKYFPIRYKKERFDRSIWFEYDEQKIVISIIPPRITILNYVFEMHIDGSLVNSEFVESIGEFEKLLISQPLMKKLIRGRKLKKIYKI